MSKQVSQEKLELSLPDISMVNGEIARKQRKPINKGKAPAALPPAVASASSATNAKTGLKRKHDPPAKKVKRAQLEHILADEQGIEIDEHVDDEETEETEGEEEEEENDETTTDSDGNIVVDLHAKFKASKATVIPKVVLNDEWRVYVDYKDFKNGAGDLFEVFVIERYANCTRPMPWNFSMALFPQFKEILAKLLTEYKSKPRREIPSPEQMLYLAKDDEGFVEMPVCEHFTSRRYKYKTLVAYIAPNTFKGATGSITQDTLVLQKSFGGTGKDERWFKVVFNVSMLEPLYAAVQYVNAIWKKA